MKSTHHRHQLDTRKVFRNYERHAHHYNQHAFLIHEILNRMMDNLQLIRQQPKTLLDLGAGTGLAHSSLQSLYPEAQLISVDLSRHMLYQNPSELRLQADANLLPIKDHSIDFIFSSLMLQDISHVEHTFQECHRVLNKKGLLLFSTFGPDTLKELKACWARVDNTPHTHAFLDMHDIGDLLIHSRLLNPVMNQETLTLNYSSPQALYNDLSCLGLNNADVQRWPGVVTPRMFNRAIDYYEDYKTDAGYPATFEIIYGHAWML